MILVVVGLTVGFLAPVPGAESKIKIYYSGDAILYKGKIVIGSANTGSLELFTMNNDNSVKKFATVKALDQRFGTQLTFNDMIFSQENDRLYAYAIESSGIYKYDISDLRKANLVDQAKDNTWDWFSSLEKVSGKVATVSYRGVKIWNNDLEIADYYEIKTPSGQTGISAAQSDKFFFNVADGRILVYDKDVRKIVRDIAISQQAENIGYHHQIYNNKVDGSIFIADDAAVKKLNMSGEIEKSFKYKGPFGYDVAPSYDARYIYFSNGIGVVKLNKEDLSVVSYQYTSALANAGGWAMGIKAVKDASGKEKLVVFNNSNILVLDGNLNPLPQGDYNIASFAATEESNDVEISQEKLFLGIDKNRAPVNSDVILRGGGFAREEALTIDFAGTKYTVQTGYDGRFKTTMKVPSVVKVPNSPKYFTDIKVTGNSSKLTYSIAFEIEE